MRRFIVAWKQLGHQERLDAHIVNYADDFVICTRGRADEAQTRMREIMGWIKLTVNDKKTRRATLPEDAFTFLGYTFCRQYSRRTGAAYLGCRPAVKKIRKLCGDISELTDRRRCLRDVSEIVAQLNQKIRGWANYFRRGPKVRVYAIVMRHARRRLRRWLCKKHRVQDRKHARFSDTYLHQQLHLLPLDGLAQSLLNAKA
jgi:RNA-directed DNA polymerase